MAGVKGKSGHKIDKPWTDALRLAVNRADGDKKILARLAQTLVSKAQDGDMQALIEIGNRLDGKPATPIEVSGELDNKHYVVEAKPTALPIEDWAAKHGDVAQGTKH